MPSVGSAGFKIGTKYENMDDVCAAIYGFTNTSGIWIQQRIQELNGVQKRRGYDIGKDLSGDLDKSMLTANIQYEDNRPMLADIKYKGMIGAAMHVLSREPDIKLKAVALVYLMSETPLYVRFPDEFVLAEDMVTDFDYILRDNTRLNAGLREAAKIDISNDESFDNLRAELRANVDEDIAEEILRYDPADYLKISTGNFYKVLSNKMGERFNTQQKECVKEFLKQYKNLLKNSGKGKQAVYCKLLGITMADYTRDNINKAVKPIREACLVATEAGND